MFGTNSTVLAANNLAARGEKPGNNFNVLVVNQNTGILTKVALLLSFISPFSFRTGFLRHQLSPPN